MSDKINAAKAIERLAQSYQAVIDAAAMLQEIGQVEQHRDEVIKAKDAAIKELEAVNKELVSAKADVKKSKADIEARSKLAESDALEVVAAANQQANELLDVARVQAGEIIEAGKAKDDANRNKAMAELVKIRTSVEVANADLAAINDRKVALEAATNDAEKRLDAARAKVKSLISE